MLVTNITKLGDYITNLAIVFERAVILFPFIEGCVCYRISIGATKMLD